MHNIDGASFNILLMCVYSVMAALQAPTATPAPYKLDRFALFPRRNQACSNYVDCPR